MPKDWLEPNRAEKPAPVTPPPGASDLLGPIREHRRKDGTVKRWRTEIVTDCKHKGAVHYGNGTSFCKDCGGSRAADDHWRRTIEL